MQQHPVPQHIASYEFRLVGDMTLKQFGMLAGCGLMAILFYASGLPGYFKWPLVLFFVLLGVGMAFFPIEERPLHRWLISFFKAVYSPTQYLWKKEPAKIELFEGPKVKPEKAEDKVPPAADTGQLNQYLASLPAEPSPLEKKEAEFLKKVGVLFQSGAAPAPFPSSSPPSPKEVESGPPVKTPPSSPKVPEVEKKPPLPPASPTEEPEAKTAQKPTLAAGGDEETGFLHVPKTPNLLIGLVVDPQGKIIEGAIIEIRNSQGVPVRALKTNKLGQFRTATPLENDVYEIETEKTGFDFDIIKLELKGKEIPPLKIKAKGASNG